MRYLTLVFVGLLLRVSAFGQGVINDGALMVISTGATVVIAGGGNCLNQTNGTNHGKIDLDGNLFVSGNFTNNASSGNVFINIEGTPDGTVHLNGVSQQTLGGAASTYFENLTLNNSAAGNAILLSVSENVKGTLTFTDGIMGTGANRLIVENTAIAGITGHGVSSYINGNLRRYLLTGAYEFPVGTLANYELITPNVTTQGALTYVDASFTAASPGAVPGGLAVGGTAISTFLDYGYWTVTPDNGATTTMDVTVVSRGHSNGGTIPEQHALFKRTGGGAWENFGTHLNATQSGTLTNPITAKRTAYSSVSANDYVVGRSAENALPIELLYFTASCAQDSGVVLHWATSSELNNNYFTLFRSNDAANWSEVARVKGAGNSNSVVEYSYTDQKATQHDTYYKLMQTDFDGKSEEFDIVYNYCKYNHKKFTLYPNPANGFIVFEFYNEHHLEDVLQIDVYNSQGKLCYTRLFNSAPEMNVLKIDFPSELSSGTYFMQVKLANQFFYSGSFVLRNN